MSSAETCGLTEIEALMVLISMGLSFLAAPITAR
jgi:hypothetical protein